VNRESDALATAGSITRHGVSPEQRGLNARPMGMCFRPRLYRGRTELIANIALPLEIIGLSKENRTAGLRKIWNLVNLTGFEKKFPWQLSGPACSNGLRLQRTGSGTRSSSYG